MLEDVATYTMMALTANLRRFHQIFTQSGNHNGE
jgi:hypothetical protein